MTDVINHDILKTKEESYEPSYDDHPEFLPALPGDPDTYPIGSIFLSLRRGQTVKTEFGSQTFTKKFEEIVLSPDGRVGVLNGVRRSRIG